MIRRGALPGWIGGFLVLFLALAPWARAGEVDIDLSGYSSVLQQQAKTWLEDLSREVGLAVSYLPLAPAEPLGWTGFDVGLEATFAQISSDSDFWKNAVTGGASVPNYLILPKLHVQKGLPLGLDVGLVGVVSPQGNVSLWGGELKWAVLRGSLVTPALALRATYTRLSGVDALDLRTLGLDVSVSKGIGPLTPYAGVGRVWIRAEENLGLGIGPVTPAANRLFLGVRLRLLLINFVAEADFSEIPLYSLRLNVGL